MAIDVLSLKFTRTKQNAEHFRVPKSHALYVQIPVYMFVE
jgi:hypothetical protein